MQRQPNQTTALALTALIMAAGGTAHAQFQFLVDQPLNASDTARRNSRADDRDEARRPAPRAYAAPEPEKKGFFGRLFSREPEPVRAQPQPGYSDRLEPVAPVAGYAQPAGTAYVRDSVRYSDPVGYAAPPAPATVPQWPPPPSATPQYTPQGQANPPWPQTYDQRYSGAEDPRSGTTVVVPPSGQSRPLQTHVVSEGVRYAPGAEPAVTYRVPAGARTTPGVTFSGSSNDPFGGQRPMREEPPASAAPPLEVSGYPAAQPQWPPAQPVAPQYPPPGNASPGWPYPSDSRVIGAQAVTPGTTVVVPPAGAPRPLTTHVVNDGVRYAPNAVPAGYPVPEQRYRNESVHRPGFFSRLFGAKSSPEAPATAYSTSGGVRYAPGAEVVGAPRIYDDSTMRPLPAPSYQAPPPPEFTRRTSPPVTPSPAYAPQQDPFSGQRPTRRTNEYIPEVPPNSPAPSAPRPWGAPRGSLDAPPYVPSATMPANLSPAEERLFQPGVKPEDRRYLMYLYAKTGRAELAEPLAQEILAGDPANKEALLAMSSLFTDQKDAGRALNYATQLYRAYPDSDEALYYYGAASQLAGNYQEAAGVLRHLRLEKFAGKPFPYQLDLAGAAEKSGDWRTQMTAYQELLNQNQVDDQTRVMVRRVLEPMQREHGDQVTAQGTAYLLDSGQLWQEKLGGRTQVSGRNQLYAEAMREDVLVRGTTVLNRRWADDTEGSVGLLTTWSGRWTTDLWAGGYQDGLLGGARLVHRLPSSKGSVWLEAYGNERARDGLLLNSLDGRQHRLTLAGNYLFAERFETYGTLTGREVVVDGNELAVGLQGNWGVEFLARRESPEFKVGYRGAYHANTRKTGGLTLVAPALAPALTVPQQTQVLDSLVLHWLHREGVYADLRDRLWGPLFYHLQGGADYAFERDSMEFGARAGLFFQPRKSLEFGTEIAYTTSAATTDGGSDLWEVGVTMKWWF